MLESWTMYLVLELSPKSENDAHTMHQATHCVSTFGWTYLLGWKAAQLCHQTCVRSAACRASINRAMFDSIRAV